MDPEPPDPVADITTWIVERALATERTAIIGVHGPQGAGKSTLCARIVTALAARDLRAVALSIDDLYLTHAEQRALAAAHPGNRALEHRGYPGTHDVALGVRTLDALARRDHAEVAVPAYDKSAHAGRGDRHPEAAWPRVVTPLDVVLLEGWMLAFTAVPDATVPEPDLAVPNRRLDDYAPWRARLDALIVLAVADGDLAHVVRWRVDAERQRRAAGAPGLSDEEARDYVERFLPGYRLWDPALAARAPIAGPVLRIDVGPDRRPLVGWSRRSRSRA
ncbi:MAG: kinase [Deltaproteobacteria bacterium]|nr:kinase [Deltaproteobacteria bacterium]